MYQRILEYEERMGENSQINMEFFFLQSIKV